MGLLSPHDEELHYEDGSHRWSAPGDVEPETWERVVRAHQARHLAKLDGGEPVRVTLPTLLADRGRKRRSSVRTLPRTHRPREE